MESHTLDAKPTHLNVHAAQLLVTQGPDKGKNARIDQPSFTIGTGDECDFKLTDPAVSRNHVSILLDAKGLILRDTSKNGTWLGGIRLRDAVLTTDTAITIGGTVIQLTLEAEAMSLPLSRQDRFGEAIGVSNAMKHVFATLERLATTDVTLLLEGESGVGKDLLSREVHRQSPRRDQPFVIVDCGSIPENLIESELFGHEKGAFTGATESRAGVFVEADGGTLFLDEIGELPLAMQPKLLRSLEQREIRPVGGKAARKVDVRVIAATNRRLPELVKKGTFRSDLYFRLAVAKLTVPALRDRPDDIIPTATALLRSRSGDPNATLPPDFCALLKSYNWPGNVRELANVIERFAVLGRAEAQLFDANTTASDDLSHMPYHEARRIVLERFEREYLPGVLERAGGVVARAAELAQVARPSFYRMMERLEIAKANAERGQ
jgi:transcriptional regulator with PAS, ATPase and Fis domain